ncbi:MAG: hypothetical protein ACKO2N_16840 [Tabrizicola sp.]
MQKFLKSAALAAMVLHGSVAYAGGPVIIEEGNDELIEANTVNSAGILPVLGVLLLVGLLAGGDGGGGGAATTPEPEPEKCPGGC